MFIFPRARAPYFIEVPQQRYLYQIHIINDSVIYDISNLVPDQQKQLVDYFVRDLWESRASWNPQWCLVVLEEAQLYLKNIRGSVAQNLLRIASAGRNKQVRTLGITPDLSLIDPAFIRLCQQRYHGRLGIEMTSKRRYKSYYGKEWLETTMKLTTGEFVYLCRNQLKQIRVPLFEPVTKPQRYTPPVPPRKSFWSRIFGK